MRKARRTRTKSDPPAMPTQCIPCPCNRLRSRRQREVLHLLIAGRDDKHISRALSIKSCTVHDHLKGIYKALGVSGRCELLGGLLQLAAGSFECAEAEAGRPT